jgi:molybdopterin-guanine dinucleotide biosynthesis protein A
MHEFLASIRMRVLEPEDFEGVPRARESFFNVNAPDDLRRGPERR